MDRLPPQPTTRHLAFAQLFSSTRRGARLARLLTVDRLRSWGAPEGLTERAEAVVAELAANAVLHGHLPGRGFRLTLVLDAPRGRLRLDVTDARGDKWPPLPPANAMPDTSLGTGGRGLALVEALVDHWETLPHPPGGKTVRAELAESPRSTAPRA
ncbi:ATP-binding protein [Streptomyces sp. NPDC127039]|uniref:ATP-binding protein n=1 Tax=Streptomyces sp. NPDC127039 TaxID=3347115 RepID=UPI003652A481